MECVGCKVECKRFGKNRNGSQRFRCMECKKTYSAAPEGRTEGFNLPTDKIVLILQLLVEGCSVRTVERITETHRDTILKVLVHAGEKCERLLGSKIVNVPVKDVECDEIWGFVQKKQKAIRAGDARVKS